MGGSYLMKRSDWSVMMTRRLLFLSALVACAPLHAQQTPARTGWTIDEWPVPWQRTRPRDPYVDAQGKVWFVGQVGNYVAVLDPATSQFRRYELDPGTLPHTVSI